MSRTTEATEEATATKCASSYQSGSFFPEQGRNEGERRGRRLFAGHEVEVRLGVPRPPASRIERVWADDGSKGEVPSST